MIAEHLDVLQPSPPIIGTLPAERAETRMWVPRIYPAIAEPMITGCCAAGRTLFAPRLTLLGSEAANLKAMAREKLLWLDQLMQGRTRVCGNRLSLADLLRQAFIEFSVTVGKATPPAATSLPKWHKRAAARPSAAA